MAVCSSCGRNDADFVVLQCPGAGCDGRIVRCAACRRNENKYSCDKCGFTGP
ncbi:MAG: RNA-binding protein [Candidatus Micrarchaeota archaeon]